MILLWVKSNQIGSKLIRYGLEEDASHFAVAFFATRQKGLLLHQHLDGGFSIDWLPHYLKTHEVVKALTPKDLDKNLRAKIMHSIMNRFSGTEYDSPAFMFFSWHIFLKKYFNKPLPKANDWSRPNKPLCTGLAKVLFDIKPEWFAKPITDFDITTPGALYSNLDASNKLRQAELW